MTKFEIAMERLDAAVDKIKNSEYIQIEYENGTQVTGRMMCTFDCEPMHQVYMIFTDDTKTQEGLYQAYAAKFHILLGYGPDGDEKEMRLELVDGQNHEEMDMIQGVIKRVLSKGVFVRKPICKLRFEGIQKVYFN